MLRYLLTFGLTAAALVAGQAGADVYKYTDEKGQVQYTDKPRTLPAERLNVQSQKTDLVTVQARHDAEMKRLQEQDAARQQTATERTDQRQAEQINAKDKAERCAKARERYDSYTTARGLYEALPNGERRYLTDAELEAARASAKTSMDVLCK